jgi:hypothetical protein
VELRGEQSTLTAWEPPSPRLWRDKPACGSPPKADKPSRGGQARQRDGG